MPEQPEMPAKPEKVAKPVKVDKPGEAAKAVKPVKIDKPGDAAKAVKPVEPEVAIGQGFVPPPTPYEPATSIPAAIPQAPLPYAAPAPYLVGPQKPPTTLSLLAMIFGIVGVALACCYGAGFLFAIAGIVLGHLGRKREAAQGMALAGLITGYAGAALSLIMWVVLFLLMLTPLLFLPFMTSSGY